MLCGKYILAPECREEYLLADYLRETFISAGGRSSLCNYYRINRPDPVCARLIFTLSGTGQLETHDKIYKLTAGDVCLLLPHQSHYYYLVNETWDIAWVGLNKDYQFPASIIASPVQKCNYSNLFGEIITQLSQHNNNELDTDLKIQLSNLLRGYVKKQLKSFHAPMVTGERLKFEKLYNLIMQNLEYQWDLDSLMKRGKLYYSKVHFNRLCCRYWGEPAIKTVIALRLNESARLLKYSDFTVI